jgi:hypothetical protein
MLHSFEMPTPNGEAESHIDFREEICLIFSLREKIGALAEALKIFQVLSYLYRSFSSVERLI